MKILKYLIPQFLKRADAYLLQNYPIIWETKIHFILFYSTIIANLSLFGLAWLIPIDFKFVPDYDDYISPAMGWSAFSAFLILCFYFYQQSFVRIKVYTFKETVLRYCMYILVLISLGTNILALPQGIAFRVRQAYSKEEIKKDFFDLARMEYLTDLTKFILNRTSESESSKYFEILQKSPLNKNREVSEILQGLKDYNEIIDKKHILDYEEKSKQMDLFLKKNQEYVDKLEKEYEHPYSNPSELLKDSLLFLLKDHQRIQEAIRNHTRWNENLKKELISRIQLHKTLNLSQLTFLECYLEFLTTTSQKILPKYVSSQFDKERYYSKYEEERSSYDYDSYYYEIKQGVRNLSAFYHANFFLQTKYNFYTNTNRFFEGINDYIIEINNFDDIFFERERVSNENILSFLSESKKEKYILFLMDEKIVNAKIEEFLWKEDISKDFSSSLLGLFIAQLALVLLATKFFSFRNVFISGFGMMAGAFLAIILLYGPFSDEIRLFLFGEVKTCLKHDYLNDKSFFIHFIASFLFLISTLFVLYAVRQKTNLKWLKTLFVFLFGSTIALQLFGFEYLLGRYEHEIYAKNLTYLYAMLILVMFALYYLYNRMLALPLKK